MTIEKEEVFADDYKNVLKFMKSALEQKGYNVFIAESREDAIRIVSEVAKENKRNPYVIFLSGRVADKLKSAEEFLKKQFGLEKCVLH